MYRYGTENEIKYVHRPQVNLIQCIRHVQLVIPLKIAGKVLAQTYACFYGNLFLHGTTTIVLTIAYSK